MNQAIQDFIGCKRIAVVGYSRNICKFGNYAYAELQKRGYQVFAVHPTEKEISGVKCYPNLQSLRGEIDAVLISIQPERVVPILEEASTIGVKNVWLQQGAESVEALLAADRLGLAIVAKKCVLMYAPPVRSFHGLHRSFTRLFGHL
ncbi:MAG: CoA-binding protein [Bacteroidota bacterium]